MTLRYFALGMILMLVTSSAAASPLEAAILDYEVGPLHVFRNDQRYGEVGTPYDADDVGLRRNLFLAQRLSAEAWITRRHAVILLYAPVDITTRVTLESPIVFRGARFETGAVVDHRYLFDGYRASYLFQLLQTERLELGIGATLQVRNAAVQLSTVDGTLFATENDIGIVPALKLRARYTLPSGIYGMLEADGLSTFGIGETSGGILDAALTLGVPLSQEVDGLLRLRWLGGGADVPSQEIYNFAWLGSASIGFRVRWAGSTLRSNSLSQKPRVIP